MKLFILFKTYQLYYGHVLTTFEETQNYCICICHCDLFCVCSCVVVLTS